MGAKALNFDHLRTRTKPLGLYKSGQSARERFGCCFVNSAAAFANQKHHRFIGHVMKGAGDIGVAAFKLMREPGRAQKIKRAINGDGRLAFSGCSGERVNRVIGADRTMGGIKRFEHRAADGCEFQTLIAAVKRCRSQGLRRTRGMLGLMRAMGVGICVIMRVIMRVVMPRAVGVVRIAHAPFLARLAREISREEGEKPWSA